MSDLDGLKDMGLVLNPPYMGDWPVKVGQYMLNFGALELFSYQHLVLLEPDRAAFNKNLSLLLGDRIKRLTVLVQESPKLSRDLKADLLATWSKVQQLSVWRNRIAHNPVLPTWKQGSDSDGAPPDLLGVPDMKQLKTSNVTDSVSIDGMDRLIDDSASLGERLHALSRTLKTAV